MRILLLVLITITGLAQEVPIVQHSSFCEGVSALAGFGVYRERIKEVKKNDVGRDLITAVVVRKCGQPIFPLSAECHDDTLLVKTSQVSLATYDLENGQEVSKVYNDEECNCAFEFRIEVLTNKVSIISIDEKILERTDEKYQTYPKRYFVFNRDTTGFQDEYGRRQGYTIIKRKNDMLKSYWKDDVQISCELVTLEGKLIAKEKDCYPFISKAKE